MLCGGSILEYDLYAQIYSNPPRVIENDPQLTSNKFALPGRMKAQNIKQVKLLTENVPFTPKCCSLLYSLQKNSTVQRREGGRDPENLVSSLR